MVIILIADTTAIQIIPAIARSYITNSWVYTNFYLIGPQYDKDIIDGLREVASPSGAGLTFTLFLGLS